MKNNPLPNSLDELNKMARELGLPCEMLPLPELKRLIAAELERRKEAKRQRIYVLLTTLVTLIAIYLTQK